MSATAAGSSARPEASGPRRGSTALALLFFIAAGVGAVGTWSFNLAFVPSPDAPSYLEGWFANAAASSLAVDVIVVAVVACIFYVVEAVRLGRRWLVIVAVVLIPLTFAIALAFTFPLFLALREVVRLRGPAEAARPRGASV